MRMICHNLLTQLLAQLNEDQTALALRMIRQIYIHAPVKAVRQIHPTGNEKPLRGGKDRR